MAYDIKKIQVQPWNLMSKEEELAQATKLADAAAAADKANATAGAIGAAGGLVGQMADPQGVGLGPAVSSGASMGATGFALGGAPGAAIGAAIGLGLGLFGASNNRKAKQAAADAKAGAIMAQGMQDAASMQPKFRFGGGRGR